MKQPKKTISVKQSKKLKLKLLSPNGLEAMTKDKIINFYSSLINIFANEV